MVFSLTKVLLSMISRFNESLTKMASIQIPYELILNRKQFNQMKNSFPNGIHIGNITNHHEICWIDCHL
jgi:hypothetical protein